MSLFLTQQSLSKIKRASFRYIFLFCLFLSLKHSWTCRSFFSSFCSLLTFFYFSVNTKGVPRWVVREKITVIMLSSLSYIPLFLSVVLAGSTSPLPRILYIPSLTETQITVPLRPLDTRANPCFIVGTAVLPAEVQNAVTAIQSSITCSAAGTTTIGSVPDVSSGGVSFSSIDFSKSSQTPLEFALSTFPTAKPLASTDLTLFENRLNTYLATEAGLRSSGGSLQIKDPKFFLAFQVARIKVAKGIVITDPGQTVEHLLGKVLKNGARESQATKDKVTALSKALA